jgi:hypothetical protein
LLPFIYYKKQKEKLANGKIQVFFIFVVLQHLLEDFWCRFSECLTCDGSTINHIHTRWTEPLGWVDGIYIGTTEIQKGADGA